MKRILLKLSGEALQGERQAGLDHEVCVSLAKQLKQLQDEGIQVAVVIGGGNIFRGVDGQAFEMERAAADHAGMLATVINGIVIQQILFSMNAPARVVSALGGTDVVEDYNYRRCLKYLDKGDIVIFVGGTGNPFFTTDTCAALRAAQVKADVVLKATKVDGVYDKDPVKYPDAKRYDFVTYDEALDKQLGVMDATAISLCRENGLPIKVFSIDSIWEAVSEPKFGTRVGNQ